MRFKSFLFLIFTVATLSQSCADEVLYKQKSQLSSEESQMFQKIKKVYPDFYFSKDVIRYFKNENGKKSKTPFFIEMIFQKKGNLYFEKYISYSVCYEADSKVIKYAFDAGTAERGEGSILFSEDKILNMQLYCGTSGCETYILENNKIIYPKK